MAPMNQPSLESLYAAIDAVNQQDPNAELDLESIAVPKEWLYGQRMTQSLERFAPNATSAVRIAARGQHIARWSLPRQDFPMTREGYLRWRTTLYGYHADRLEALMREAGWPEDEIQSVRKIVQKKSIKSDPEVQLVEDVACLVFLEFYFRAFAKTQTEEKLIPIIQKTWRKMSEAGHAAALTLPFSEAELALIGKALETA